MNIEKVINTMYFPPVYEQRTFKVLNKDVLILTIQDVETLTTRMEIIPEPTIDYYVVKDEYKHEFTYPQMETDRNKVEKFTCRYAFRNADMARRVGMMNEYKEAKKDYTTFRTWFSRNILNHPHIFMGDVDIEDYYKFKVYKKNYKKEGYEEKPIKLKKSYMDIECDQYDAKPNAPKPSDDAIYPVNFITHFIERNKTMNVFLLENQKDNPEFYDVKNNPTKFLTEYILNDEDFDKDLSFEFLFFEDEVDLIINYFDLVKTEKSDICNIWFLPFDIPYLMKRLQKFNVNVAKVICDNDIPDEFKRTKYITDSDRNRTDFNKAKHKPFHQMMDWVSMSGYTQFMDQMAIYSNLRKRFTEPSYKLDAITEKELGYGKVDLEEKGLEIKTAAHTDFKQFLKYSIKDTYVLYKLEEKTTDLDNYLLIADNTRIQKGINNTFVLKNLYMKELLDHNMVIGNNTYYDNMENFKIDGAIVAEMSLVAFGGEKILGKPSRLYKYIVDLDLTSLYPSVMLAWNVSKCTVYEKMTYIVDPVSNITVGDGQHFAEQLQTRQVSIGDICNKYFDLPNIDEMLDIIGKEFGENIA